MQKNNVYDYEATKALIYDGTNVTENNPIAELFKILTKLVLILACIYFSIFISSGIIIKNLSVERQVELEKILTPSFSDIKEISDKNAVERCNSISRKIISIDSDFPKTFNMDIGIMETEEENAFCYPNGKIYITSPLYKKLSDDDMLTFVIAHEMAHYKNKDHLMSLRKNISGGAVIILMSVLSGKDSEISKILNGGITLTDLKHSRKAEYKADAYAGKILKQIYGNVDGGLKVLKMFDGKDLGSLDIISTHPETKKRILILNSQN